MGKHKWGEIQFKMLTVKKTQQLQWPQNTCGKIFTQREPLAIFWNTGTHLRIRGWSSALQLAPYTCKKREIDKSSNTGCWHSKNVGLDVAKAVLKLFYKMKNYKSKCTHFAEMHPIQSLLLGHRLCSAGDLPAAWQHQMLKSLVFQALLL